MSKEEIESFDESEELDEDIVTMVDDEGNEVDFMILAIMEVDGKDYAMLSPVEDLAEEADADAVELYFYSYDEEADEFGEIEDEDLHDRVQAAFAELMEQVGDDDEA
jgi:uncharacterized protein YrzB (UPF0473 family)